MLDFRRFNRGIVLSSCAERVTVGGSGLALIRLLLGDDLCSGLVGVLAVDAGRFCWDVVSEETPGVGSVSESCVAS